MNGIPELGRGRSLRIVEAEVAIVGLLPVRAPIPLELSRGPIEHGDAFVEVPVGDEGFFTAGVEGDLGHSPEVLLVVAPAGELRLRPGRALVASRSGVSELLQELSIPRELKDVRISLPVAADPEVIHGVDGDPVVRLRPVVPRAGAAPVTDEVPLGVELQNGRSGNAALDSRWWFGGGAHFRQRVQGSLPMDDEDVVPRIDGHADGRTNHPLVGQGLRPEGVHLERRRLDTLLLSRQSSLEGELAETEAGERGQERGADRDVLR